MIGSEYLELATLAANVTNCTNSYFKLEPDLFELGLAFNMTNSTTSVR